MSAYVFGRDKEFTKDNKILSIVRIIYFLRPKFII